MSAESNLNTLNITLPYPAAPVANYVGYVLTNKLLVISGQLAFGADGKINPSHIGQLGNTVSIEDATEAARLCAINILAQAKAALGSLDKIKRCVRLGGFVNSIPEFANQPKVINGASDLMVAVLEDKGRHARAAVGVPSLPLNCCVEIDAMFEVE